MCAVFRITTLRVTLLFAFPSSPPLAPVLRQPRRLAIILWYGSFLYYVIGDRTYSQHHKTTHRLQTVFLLPFHIR